MDNGHHEKLVSGLYGQLKTIFDKSEQAIYLYLDDPHKVCNENFARLLGYDSEEEWANVDAPLADVLEEDQRKVVEAYEKATEKMLASQIKIRVKNIKSDKIINTVMTMVPIVYEGHIFSLHFISKL